MTGSRETPSPPSQPPPPPGVPLPPPPPGVGLAPAPRRKRRWWRWLAAGAVAYVAVATVAIVGTIHLAGRPRPPAAPAPAVETPEQVAEAARAAFNGDDYQPSAEQRAELNELFQTIQRAIQQDDADAFRRRVDGYRMLEEVRRFGPYRRAQAAPALAGLLADAIVETFIPAQPEERWRRFEVREVKPLGEDEALVYLWHWKPDCWVSRTRWWLRRRRDGKWCVYDYEDYDIGNRVSRLQIDLDRAPGGVDRWDRLLELRDRTVKLTADGKADQAARLVEGFREQGLSDGGRTYRWSLLAYVRQEQGRFDDALAACDAGLGVCPTHVDLLEKKATALVGMERMEQALAVLDQTDALHGPCDRCAWLRGQALEQLGRTDESAAAYNACLGITPDLEGVVGALARVLPEEEKDQIAAHFRRLADPGGAFGDLASGCLQREDLRGLAVLVKVRRDLGGGEPLVDYYDAEACALAGEPRRAAELFAIAAKGFENLEDRQTCLAGQLDELMKIATPQAAYAASPDPEYAVWYVGRHLVGEGDQRGLEMLVAAHRRDSPDDPWGHYFDAERLVLAGETDQADAAYARAMRMKAPEGDHEAFRARRTVVLYRAGRGLEAYRRVEPAKKTFDQLAWLMADDKDDRQLEALVKARQASETIDRDVGLWLGEVHWIRGQWRQTVDVLRQFRGAICINPHNVWRVEDRLVRGLIRLGLFDEAMSEAKASTERDDDPYYEAVVHAVAGRVERTARILGLLAERGYAPAAFYDDDQLGPALRTEPFKALREKYPPPEEGKPDGGAAPEGPSD